MGDHSNGPAVFVSADIEGCATLVHWDEVMPSDGPSYERARRIMAAEVNAVLEGAFAAGAQHAVINDAHSTMRNLVKEGLESKSQLVSGRLKPHYMLEGIKARPNALAFFVGYHGAIGDEAAVMGHTYSPRVIFECRLQGLVVGELTINAALAGHLGVPVVFVSGDRTTLAEAQRNIPWATRVETKRSLSYYAAECTSPQMVQEALRTAATSAVRRRDEAQLYKLQPPISLEVETLRASQVDALEWLPGFSRAGSRTIAYAGDDMESVYRALLSIIYLGVTA